MMILKLVSNETYTLNDLLEWSRGLVVTRESRVVYMYDLPAFCFFLPQKVSMKDFDGTRSILKPVLPSAKLGG